MPADLARASGEAVRLLLSQRLYRPRIDVTSFRFNKNIIFDTFSGFCEKSRALLPDLEETGADGYTIRRNNADSITYLVLYDDSVNSRGRKNFTLAHELGHIYLGHERDGEDEEGEANRFAAELLLPRPLVWELLSRTRFSLSNHELADIFGVSKLAAQNRANTLKRMASPVFSHDEALLLKKFGGLLPHLNGPFIDI